jgi:hypothetical protein
MKLNVKGEKMTKSFLSQCIVVSKRVSRMGRVCYG